MTRIKRVYLIQWIWTLGLQPLLVSMMRDECAAIPTLNADLLPGRPDDWDGFVYRSRALEVRGIGCKLTHESPSRLEAVLE